jgi:hypothetical protein
VNITDGLLVVAVDVVAAVAADARPALSGKKQLRLLAWMLADARGAQTPMEKALAETVGKRLERQAQRVRPMLEAAAEAAAEAAQAARAAVASDPEMESTLTQQLCQADSAAFDEHERLRDEVYVGFNELHALLQPRPSPEEVEASTAGEGLGPESVCSKLQDALLQAQGLVPAEPIDQDTLLQCAFDHLMKVEARLDSERSRNAELRAELVSARRQVAEAELQAWEAGDRATRVERQLARSEKEAAERMEQATSQLEDARAAADMEHIGEKNELKARIRGLGYELALLKGTG